MDYIDAKIQAMDTQKKIAICIIFVLVATLLLFFILKVDPLICETLWDKAQSAGDETTNHMRQFYTGIFFPVFIASLAGAIFFKDPKIKALCASAAVGSLVFFMIFGMKGIIEDTLNRVAQDWGGTSSN